MKRALSIALLILLAAFLCGCAQTVTPVFPAGKTMTIIIDYKDNIDPILNKYYIVFNNNAAPTIPFMPVEFVEPGEIPSNKDIDYYGKYYSTWKNYIVMDGNTFYYVRGGFTSEAYPTKEVLATWSGVETHKITLTFDMDRLGTLKERLNFDFISVDKSTKMVKDNLSSLNSSPSPYYVFTISDSTATGSDEGTSDIRGSMDILDWRVLVQ